MRTIHVDTRSERGIALIVVLLMMVVLSGLATGFAMNGRVESGMAQNETYWRRPSRGWRQESIARRPQSAWKSIRTFSPVADGVAGNADDGDLGFLLTGGRPTCSMQPADTYAIEILDDDDPRSQTTDLTAAQLDAMSLAPERSMAMALRTERLS